MKIDSRLLGALALIATSSYLSAAVIVEDWQFDTIGDTEGWIATTGTSGLDVRAAVSGSETVLSGKTDNTDPKIFYNPEITAPSGLVNWETLSFRIRQLDAGPLDPGVAPIAYDNTSSIVIITGAGGNYGSIPLTTSGNYTITSEANEWRTVEIDLTKGGTESYTGNITQIRIDPAPSFATSVGGYEVDFVTLTAAVIPEPSIVALGAGLLVGGLAIVRRRGRRS